MEEEAGKSPGPRLLECGLRGRKLELEHFLNQCDVDKCLLSETFLDPGQAFRQTNNVCHCTDKQLRMVQPYCLLWYSPPLSTRSELTHLEATVVSWQTVENSCGLPFTLQATDRIEPVRLFSRWVAGPLGR